MNKIKQQIEESNVEFDNASPEQKRVMIAQDVILRLEEKQLIPATGNFIIRDFVEDPKYSNEDSLKDIINEGQVCKVCAKGALFCSIIGRVNKFTVRQARETFIGIHNTEDSFHRKVLEYFTPVQVDLIETAFEGVSFLHRALSKDTKKAEMFFLEFGTYEERLIGIAQNIIDNKGEFIP